jgi:hypothetical protein
MCVMRTPLSPPAISIRPDDRLVIISTLGCLAAVPLGVIAATKYGVLALVAIMALAFFGVAIVAYIRDPILAFLGLWLFTVFNPSISAAFGYFSSAGSAIRQADEILVVLFVGLTIGRAIRTNTRIPPLRFILPGVGVAVFGLVSALLHHVPLTITALGAWLGLKLWIMLVVTLLLPWKPSDLHRLYLVFTRVGLFVAVLGLLDYVTHAAISRALHTSIYNFEAEAFRGEAVHSIFPNPGEYSLFMSVLFALTYTRFASKHNKADLVLALLFAGSVLLSLRLKGFLSLAAVVLIVALVQAFASNRGSVVVLLLSGLIFIGAYTVEGSVITQLVTKYTSTTKISPRSRLYSAGSQIADDNFPLGVGFGRFGSYPSRIYYSPVYDQYGLSGIYGLSRAYPDFIDDTTWPSVMAETGYAGLAVYLSGVIVLLLALVHRLRTAPEDAKWIVLSALCVMAVLLVTSTGQGVLFDWLAITSVALVLGPALVLSAGSPISGRSRVVS